MSLLLANRALIRSGFLAPILEYLFNNNALDTGGGGFDLSQVDGGTPPGITYENDRNSNPLSSVRFNNTITDFSYLRNLSYSSSFLDGFSMSCWMKINSLPPNVDTMLELGSGTQVRWTIKNFFGTPVDTGEITSGGTVVNTLLATALGTTWKHHVITITSSGVMNYCVDDVNIVLDAALGASSAIKVQLGWGTGGAPMDANLDVFRIYEGILSAAQITELFNE